MDDDKRRYPISIETDLYSSGCLPGLLRKEIEAVERRIATRAGHVDDPEREMTDEYLDQLRSVLCSVQTARTV